MRISNDVVLEWISIFMRVWYKDVIWPVMYSVHTGRLTGDIQYVCAGVTPPDNPSARVHMQVTYMVLRQIVSQSTKSGDMIFT